ncbi:hypothetical protein PHMEG_00023476 [Phytophthora megakarya]|uniref:Uncharacterized protein n=1 Tax=Phytophthora megakarya TaxID=4795 RepID=A0A225VHL0_9STRA|nr:hypothetical protein PHMEG_00023476 [Phytophthora megakarya]
MAERYNNDELIACTKVIINSLVKLPKHHTKGDYKAWCSEVPLHFDSRMLSDITYGPERNDEQEGLRRAKKTFSALVLSLSVDLRTASKIDEIRDNMNAAWMLYERTTQHFKAGDGITPDYLLQKLVTRKLQPNKAVNNYVDDIAFTKRTASSPSGIMKACVGKFQDLAREHGDWINNYDRTSLSLAEALQRLRAAEYQRTHCERERRSRTRTTTTTRATRWTEAQPGTAKKGKPVAEKKQHSACANCHGEGHWYFECTEKTGISL